MAASTLLLSSACKASPFSESTPVSPYFFSLKILPMEGPFDSQSRRKIIDQILGYISFCFEIHTHVDHLFAWNPKIIKFNSWSCSKNKPGTK